MLAGGCVWAEQGVERRHVPRRGGQGERRGGTGGQRGSGEARGVVRRGGEERRDGRGQAPPVPLGHVVRQ